MPETTDPETDLDRLSAFVQLVDSVPSGADPQQRVLHALEELFACECVLLPAADSVDGLVLSADELGLQVTGPDGATALTLTLRPVGRPFADHEMVLLELLRPRLVDWLAASVPGDGKSPSDGLTARQIEILRLAQLGMANKEIARSLRISVDTVRKHLEHAYERLGAVSRTGAVAAAFGSKRSPFER